MFKMLRNGRMESQKSRIATKRASLRDFWVVGCPLFPKSRLLTNLNRQTNQKCTSFAHFAFDLDSALMLLNDAVTNG
jgi:hypothetical protein